MLTNAVVAGTLAAVYIAILFLQINPHLPLDLRVLWPLLVVVVGFYAIHAATLFYMLIVLRQVMSTELLSPGWLSLRLLSWLSAGAASGAALLMWLNLQGLRTALAEEVARRLGVGAVAMGLCALALLAIAVVHYSFGRRGSVVGASLYAMAVIASVTLPIAARGQGVPRTLGAYPIEVAPPRLRPVGHSRVLMLLLDGASLDYLSLATADGRLPNFGRLLDSGAAMHLATLRPTQPGPVWATVATGQYPPRHGVISASTYRVGARLTPLELLPDHCFAQALVYLGFLDEAPASSAELRSRPLWSVLSGQGVPVGIVGWPLTHPVRPVRGFLVSDRFHLMADPRFDPAGGAGGLPGRSRDDRRCRHAGRQRSRCAQHRGRRWRGGASATGRGRAYLARPGIRPHRRRTREAIRRGPPSRRPLPRTRSGRAPVSPDGNPDSVPGTW